MNRKTAFTLVELLTVIAVISMLSAMLLPVLQKARQKAKYGRWQAYSHSLHSDPELVAYYDFEEGTGTVLNNKGLGFDIRGYDQENLNGTINNGTWAESGGRWIGKGALEFNGSSTYVDCENDSSLNITDAITIEAWVKANVKENKYHVSKDTQSSPNRDWGLGISTTRFYGFVVNVDDTLKDVQGYYYDTGVWYHTVLTYNKTAGADNVKLYVDGVIAKTNTQTGDINTGTASVYIGRNVAAYFNGTIDEVAIYSSALSAAEIMAHYKMGKP